MFNDILEWNWLDFVGPTNAPAKRSFQTTLVHIAVS